MNLWLAVVVGFPLVLAGMVPAGGRTLGAWLMPLAALPALAAAFLSGTVLDLPWLLMGTRLAVDHTTSVLLLLAGVEWTLAALYAQGYLRGDAHLSRFRVFWLLTLTGNLWVFLAGDAVSFYFAFALLSFAAYGLIVHTATPEARRAGRIYLVLAVIGEACLVAALLLMGQHLGNPLLSELAPQLAGLPERDLIIVLVLVGYGIKLGLLPLHVWLALAHPAAPTPASAVLSGVIIKAGLMGWLRFLPLGEVGLPLFGWACLSLGLLSAFYGVAAGVVQTQAKAVLAYSSISQMGLVASLFGIALLQPEAWPAVFVALHLFALHHGLAKSALFLGVGVTAHAGRWAGWLLIWPALALAGLPLSSGALAKGLLKESAHGLPGGGEVLTLLYTVSSVTTALLVLRFLVLAWPRERSGVSSWLWAPWLVLLALGLALPWWYAWVYVPEQAEYALAPKHWWSGLWPVLVALGLAGLVWWGQRLSGWRLQLVADTQPRALLRLSAPALAWPLLVRGKRTALRRRSESPPAWPRWLERWEETLRQGAVAGLGLILLVLVLGWLVLLSGGDNV